jgi:hypothetical protein
MKWDVNARDKAASKFQEHEPIGLLESFVSGALWASHPLNVVPGLVTVTDVTDAAGVVTQVITTAADTVLPRPDFEASTFPGGAPSSHAWAKHNSLCDRHRAYLKATSEFRTLLVDSINQGDLKSIAHPTRGSSVLLIDVIMERTKVLHGTPTASDVTQMEAGLAVKLKSPTDYPKHVAAFRRAKTQLAFFDHTVPRHKLFEQFLLSLSSSPVFQNDVGGHFRLFTTTATQSPSPRYSHALTSPCNVSRA